jgi:hypothetical protein
MRFPTSRDDASPEQTFLSDAVSATKIVERLGSKADFQRIRFETSSGHSITMDLRQFRTTPKFRKTRFAIGRAKPSLSHRPVLDDPFPAIIRHVVNIQENGVRPRPSSALILR